jgi:endosialidase-like protein
MDIASESLLALQPVTFRYKKEIDPAGAAQFGTVAEDVERVAPDLVVRDKQGKAYSVRYDQVNAMLLNEFLKEYRKVEQQNQTIHEQGTTIVELKKQMEAIIAHAKEQDSQIQRVYEEAQRK